MKISKSLIAAFALTAFHITSAVAGPSVTVTFKNLGTQTATYTPITNNEAITKANASYSASVRDCKWLGYVRHTKPDIT